MALKDVIIPEIFSGYVRQEAYKRSALLSSGITSSDASFRIGSGGKTVNLPFWKRNYAEDEVLSESSGMTVNTIQAGGDVACIHARGIAYQTNDLERIFAGDDPVGAIVSFMATEWANNMQKILVKTLEGAFASESMAGSVKDLGSTALSGEAMIDAQYLIGDSFGKLSGVMMHSAVMAKLKKLDLIQFEKQSEANRLMPYYMGQAVVVDDALEPTDGKYPIYFFGDGAVAFNENTDEARTEFDRDILEGNDTITTRRVFTMHPRGIKWIGNAVGATPTNAELATGTNWQLVDDRKNVAITKLLATIGDSDTGDTGSTGGNTNP